MPKAYLVALYRSVSDSGKLHAYEGLAGPAVTEAGGRFLSRSVAVEAHETGARLLTVVIEFPDVARARGFYASPPYRRALVALDGAAERDMRIVEGEP